MTMQKRPRTIQIFLPTGDPSGIRVAEVTTSIIRLIEVPRSQISEFLKMPEARQVGLYFLVGGDKKDEVYIGQTGEVGNRLSQHNKDEKKDWERALVLVSLTNNLTQTHVLYLESISIEKARSCSRFDVVNGNGGQRPHTPVPLKADCDEIHDVGSLLLATLGYPMFEPLIEPYQAQQEQMLYCTRAGVESSGYYTNEGLVVLKGSKAPFSPKRKTNARAIALRDELMEKGVLTRHGDYFEFQKDYLFPTPSGASGFLVLASSNGWLDWKTQSGQTLDEYHRVDPPPHSYEIQRDNMSGN